MQTKRCITTDRDISLTRASPTRKERTMEDRPRRGRPPRGRGYRFEMEAPPPPPGPPPFRRRGRMRRGDIRTAVLAILAEEPGHGYEVIQRLEAKSDGAWRPSPG